jgi:hypothetical protein
LSGFHRLHGSCPFKRLHPGEFVCTHRSQSVPTCAANTPDPPL